MLSTCCPYVIYGVKDIEIIFLKLVFNVAVLIPVPPGIEIFSITTFPILRILLFPSVLELIKFSTVENLSTFKIQEFYSTPAGVKFTLFQYGKLILAAAYTHLVETLEYGVEYKCDLPLNCYNTATAITGNNGSSGQFKLFNNVLIVKSTDSQAPLRNTFMGQLTTFLK